MPDLLNIGTSALLSFQTSLNTTSNNIANANTDGYTRQRTNLDAIAPTFLGGFFVGSGVEVDSVQRIYDQFLQVDLINRSSSFASADSYLDFASRLDSLFSNSGVGLQQSIDGFYSSLQDVANNPSSLPERQALIGQAEQFVSQFNTLNDALAQINQQVSSQVQVIVSDINSLTTQIAQVNDQIASVQTATSSELLDERDRLVLDLASRLSINTVEQTDGSLNVFLADGTSLVAGTTSNNLTAFSNEFDVFDLEIGLEGLQGGLGIPGTELGGSLGGTLTFRDELLESSRAQLGLLAASITTTINEQHSLGLDLEGNIGQEFFADFSLDAVRSSANTGSATIGVVLDDVDQLTADEYELSFDGTVYTLTNLTDNSSQTGAGPFSVNGITVTPAGTADAGDSFLIQPARDALEQFSLAINDPRSIAAASAVRAEQPISNAGSAAISDLTVTDSSSIPLGAGISLTFNPDALGPGIPGFDVTGIAGGPLAYDPSTESGGTVLSLPGFEFLVTGTPEPGDTLSIVDNAGGIGDNSNANALANLQDNRRLLNGTSSQQDIYSSLVADVGITTSRVETSLQTESLLLDQAEQAVASVSGVNLDEEAADLIRFQQAFQAAAQIISIADELFATLLNATGR